KEQAKVLVELNEITEKFNPFQDRLSIYTKNYEQAKSELEKLQQKCVRVEEKLSKFNTRNVQRKLKRRDNKIKELEDAVKQSKIQTADFQRTINELQGEINEVKLDLQATEMSRSELEDKLSNEKKAKRKVSQKLWYKSQKNSCIEDISYDKNAEKELKFLNERIDSLKKKNTELEELVSLFQDEEVVSFHDGRYKDEIRETVMELLACNVSMAKVSKVIRIVLQKLTNRSIARLPSVATISQIAVEARHLADIEVAQSMHCNNPSSSLGNCLHGDGTTKYHK
ncbi:uncharacterized protein ZK1098.6-like, partial [Anneissia japonica]|uniref:uncharacterized protein ZK1098.6-like n=1 Tax=Anneissia japonica TaxID=1529436 RepID=UPI001425926D